MNQATTNLELIAIEVLAIQKTLAYTIAAIERQHPDAGLITDLTAHADILKNAIEPNDKIGNSINAIVQDAQELLS